MKNKIGLGLVTYNRPDYFMQSSQAIVDVLLPYIDKFVVYNDGSSVPYNYDHLNDPKIKVIHSKKNRGVAVGKNTLFKELMKDCEYIFISEDDIVAKDKGAIIMYLAAAKMTGYDHLMFSQHGPNKQVNPVGHNGPLEYWPACVGAWCFYTRSILKEVGLMDEKFINAWEHVEHTWRIFKTHNLKYGYYPDVIDSGKYLQEIEGALENSSIGSQDNEDRLKVIIAGLEYWIEKDPTFPAAHTYKFFKDKLADLPYQTKTKPDSKLKE